MVSSAAEIGQAKAIFRGTSDIQYAPDPVPCTQVLNV
jgi:hypothetical protein